MHNNKAISLLWGISLGVALSNYPLPGGSLSIGFVWVPFFLIFVFLPLLTTHHASARFALSVRGAAVIYGIFVVWNLLRSIGDTNQYFLTYVQPLLTLPIIPLATVFLVNNFRNLRDVYKGFIGYVFLSGVVTIYFGFTEDRALGLTVNPNTTATAFSVSIVLTFMVFEGYQKWASFGIKWIVITVLGCGVLLTGSRTGIATMILAAFLMLFNNKSSKRDGLFLILVGLLFSSFYLGTFQGERIVAAAEYSLTGVSDNRGAGSIEMRLAAISAGMDMFLEKPLFGHGVGVSKTEIPARTPYHNAAHNSYVRVLADLGAVGFLVMLLFFVSIVKVMTEISKRPLSVLNLLQSRTGAGAGRWLFIGFAMILATGMSTLILSSKLLWIWVAFVVTERALVGEGKSELLPTRA